MLTFNFDGPQSVQFGIGLHPSKKLSIAADGKWIKYTGVAGIGETGWRGVRHRPAEAHSH